MSSATDALKLEISIVEALLSRNRASHGRTIYYKRMQMVMQCIRKCCLLDFASRLKRQMHDTAKMDQESNSGDRLEELEYLALTLSTTFPELVSRIEHAAKALFTEIGRGFFLPYCTVAVAALARIRILVLQMGHEGIAEMPKVGIDLAHRLPEYAVEDDCNKQASVDKHQLKLLYKSLGIAWKDMNGTISGDLSTTSGTRERKPPLSANDEVNCDGSDPEDVGLHVGMDRKNAVVAAQSERADHNFEVMMHTKIALSKVKKERKRKFDKFDRLKGLEMGKGTKKEKKQKKKKDFFDDLFDG
jgi:hypothetical protein